MSHFLAFFRDISDIDDITKNCSQTLRDEVFNLSISSISLLYKESIFLRSDSSGLNSIEVWGVDDI